MKSVFVVFGTRPEAIKMCPVIEKLRDSKEFVCKVILTGQHREMLDQMLNVFSIKADYDLNLMKEKQTLQDITIGTIIGVSNIIKKEKPNLLMVHGDTTTSYAGALAAFYEKTPVAHIEAGLRTYNMHEPFPEEFNRKSIDSISDYLFAPTEEAKKNLLDENVNVSRIFVTGNTVIDAFRKTINCNYSDDNLKWAEGSKLILVTVHRRESIGNPMHSIFQALLKIVEDHDDVKMIYPVHKNPLVRGLAQDILGNHERIRLIEPLDVISFHNYMKKSYFVMTDSGGIQEEAPSLGKPVLVLRNITERPEGVNAGTLEVVGTEKSEIYAAAKKLLLDEEKYNKMVSAVNPYGDGHASERIIKVLSEVL